MKSLRALGPALALLLLGRCSSPTPVSDASVDLGADLGDTATPAVMDASDDRFDSGVAALVSDNDSIELSPPRASP